MLLVQRADLDALFIIEHRTVDRAGNVVLGKLGRGAYVDDVVEKAVVVELVYDGDTVPSCAHWVLISAGAQGLSRRCRAGAAALRRSDACCRIERASADR